MGKAEVRNVLYAILVIKDVQHDRLGMIHQLFTRNQFMVCSEASLSIQVSSKGQSLRDLTRILSLAGGQVVHG